MPHDLPYLTPEPRIIVLAAGPRQGYPVFPPIPAPPAGGAGAAAAVEAIPFTGIAAAEAALQAAISLTPPFPGMDVGRELGRLARRAADLRR